MYDVVVLGAGLSGLSAAWLLRETGLNVLVLEARDRVGGRTHTVQSPQFGCTDVGGAYVGPTQTHILRLARELGLETYPVDHTQSSLLELQGTVRPFRGVIPPVYNPIGLLDLSNTMATVDKMASKIPRECPWEYPGAQELDSITAKELMERITWTGSTRNLLNIFIRSVFCVEAHEISALSLLWVITCGNGIERITNISGGAQERKFEAGAQAVSETLSERIGKERIRLGTPVLRVEQGAEHVRVISEDGQSFEGLYAISAIPHAILPTVHFHPPLPTLKRLLINRMPMGSVIKVVTFYKRAFWKEKGFNGCTMSNSGCVTFSMDDTKPDGSHPAMMGFIQAETARRMCLDTLERRKASVCQHYARIFKMEEFLHPVDYVEKNWTEEAYSGGCYSSTFGPGVLTSFGEALRQPVGRIHFAGTELASQWPGYMDGAVQSGERAAREVLRQLGRNGSEEISQAEASPPSDGVPTPEGGSWLARVLPTRHTLLHFGGVVLAAGLAWFFQSKL